MSAPVAALTGGSGFLGRYVLDALLRDGWRVRLLTRRPIDHAEGVTPVAGDLEDPACLARLVAGAAAVIHLAGLVKARSRQAFLAVNRDGAGRLACSVAREAPGARFVLVSSQAARRPELSAYAASKRAGEARVAAALGATDWVVLRPGVIYGPGDREGLALFRLLGRRVALTPRPPEPRLAMIHARDAASAVVALSRAGPGGAVYELADARAEGYGWSEVVRCFGTALGRPPRCVAVPDGLIRAAAAANEAAALLRGRATLFGRGKAREILHRDWSSDRRWQPPPALWRAAIDLPAGAAETVAWWRAEAGRGF